MSRTSTAQGGGGGGGTVTSVSGANSIISSPNPITGSGSLQLVNDALAPGNSKYYGTDGTGVKGFFSLPSSLPALATNHFYVGNAGVPVDGGVDATFVPATRLFTIGDTTSASGGGYLYLSGNTGTMLFLSKINSVSDSIIFTANNVSGTGLSAGFGDLSDSIAAGAGVRMLATLNNAGSTNKIEIKDGLGNVFLSSDVANGIHEIGDVSGGTSLVRVDTGLQTVFLGKSSLTFWQIDAANQNWTGMLGGNSSMLVNTTAGNTFFGYATAGSLSSGTHNSVYGSLAGGNLSSGDNNSFFGYNAGHAENGDENVYIGAFAGQHVASGNSNVYVGVNAGATDTSGISNTLIGAGAGATMDGAQELTIIGFSAGNVLTSATGVVLIGANAGVQYDGSGNVVYIGSHVAEADTSGSRSVAIGTDAVNTADGFSNGVFIGDSVGAGVTNGTGQTLIGASADGRGIDGTVVGSASNSGTGESVSIFGASSGSGSLTGNGNSFFGSISGVSVTSGEFNTLLGYGTDVPNGDRSYGIALGAYANTGSNILSIGGDDGAGNAYIDQVIIGNGSQNAAPHTVIMSLTSYDTSATDTSGKDFTFRPGMGTGTHIAGDFVMGAGTSGASGTTGNSNIDANRFNGNSIQTTNATPATMAIVFPDTNATYTVTAIISARRSSGSAGTVGDSAGYFIRGTFKCISGTLTQIGTTARDIWEDQAGWDCDFNITSNVLNVQVTGATNNTIEWKVATQFTSIVL